MVLFPFSEFRELSTFPCSACSMVGVVSPDLVRLREPDCSVFLLVASAALGADGVGCTVPGENPGKTFSMPTAKAFADVAFRLGGAVEEPAATPQLMS